MRSEKEIEAKIEELKTFRSKLSRLISDEGNKHLKHLIGAMYWFLGKKDIEDKILWLQ